MDWSRGYTPLDKELQKITVDASSNRRYADKLIKVYAHDNTETWVLIHVEVQGEPEGREEGALMGGRLFLTKLLNKRFGALPEWAHQH